MEKISFTELGLKLNDPVKTIVFNEQEIEVKQYLPVNEKLKLISNVINLSAEEENFINSLKVEVFTLLEMLQFYTDIEFTEEELDDLPLLYDLAISSGLAEKILSEIPQDEYDQIVKSILNSIKAIYAYRHSALGILNAVATDYSNLKFDANEIQQKLADPNNMAYLREVLTKLG